MATLVLDAGLREANNYVKAKEYHLVQETKIKGFNSSSTETTIIKWLNLLEVNRVSNYQRVLNAWAV